MLIYLFKCEYLMSLQHCGIAKEVKNVRFKIQLNFYCKFKTKRKTPLHEVTNNMFSLKQ